MTDESRYQQVHYRYHVSHEEGGLLDTSARLLDAFRLARCHLDDFEVVEIYDTMARRGSWQLWRVRRGGDKPEGVERRPFA